jgi:hypothetical protein
LAVVTVGCGGMVDDQEPWAESTATESGAITYAGGAHWQQGESPKAIGNVNDSVCFLRNIHGRFAGDGEEVGIYGVSPGGWHLGGKSQQTNVGASALCIGGITKDDYTNTQYWYQGNPSVPLGRYVNGSFVQVDGNWSCFLTSMRGRFDGYGEEIRTTFFEGKWWLGGKSQQQGVKAGAQCVRKPRGGTYTAAGSNNFTQIHVRPDQYACFLRQVSGLFDANTEVNLFPYDEYSWILESIRYRNPSGNEELRVYASCVF